MTDNEKIKELARQLLVVIDAIQQLRREVDRKVRLDEVDCDPLDFTKLAVSEIVAFDFEPPLPGDGSK